MKQVFQFVPPGSSNSTSASIYAVKNMRLGRLAATLMVILIVTQSLAISVTATTLTVETEESNYKPGDKVEIYGSAGANSTVYIALIYNSSKIFDENVTADGEGEFSEDYTLEADADFGTYTVTASSDGESSETYFTVVDTSKKDLAKELLRQVERLRERVQEAFDELEEENVTIPSQAEENFTLGVEAATKASEAFDAGNYTDAIELAYQALEYLGDAYNVVQSLVITETEKDTEVEGDEDDVERAYGLYMAIRRAFEFIDKVNTTADRLEAEGYTIDTEIRPRLEEANTSLTDLRSDLESGVKTVEEVAEELARIREFLGETNGLLHSTAIREHNTMMAERFMEQTQNQIRGLEEKILRLRERLEAEKVVSVGNSLGAIYRKIERLRERLGTEDLDGLLDELQLAANEIDGNLTMLNGEGMSTNLMEMNRIEARIRVLTKTAERLSRKGYNTTDVEDQLESAERLLSEMMSQLTAGDKEGTRELFKEAKEHFKEIRKNIHTSWMEELKQRIQERKENHSNGRGGD